MISPVSPTHHLLLLGPPSGVLCSFPSRILGPVALWRSPQLGLVYFWTQLFSCQFFISTISSWLMTSWLSEAVKDCLCSWNAGFATLQRGHRRRASCLCRRFLSCERIRVPSTQGGMTTCINHLNRWRVQAVFVTQPELKCHLVLWVLLKNSIFSIINAISQFPDYSSVGLVVLRSAEGIAIKCF